MILALPTKRAALRVATALLLTTACARVAARDDSAQVVLADVANSTGDTIFDRSLMTAASIALRQSPFIRLYPRSRLPQLYAMMRIEHLDTALTFSLAQAVAERAGVRWALGLSLARHGDDIVVHSELADVAGHRRLASDSTRPVPRTDVIPALDELLFRVRRSLGESRGDLTAHRASLPLVTTASIEALHSLADGSAAWDKADYQRARELWERAVDLDTTFAMALGALGGWHYYMHDRERGEQYYQQALAHADRLTERELLGLRIGRAQNRGSIDSAIALSRQLTERFPSGTSWYDVGVYLLRANRDSEAIVAFKRSLALDSLRANAWINVATSSAKLGRLADAVENYRRAERVDSTALYRGNINNEYGTALVALGRLAEAETVFRRMASEPRIDDRALGLRSLAFLAFWRGNARDAAESLRQAIDATVQAKAPLSEARNHMLLAGVYRSADRLADANHEIDRALALTPAPTFSPTLLSVLAFQCEQLQRHRDAAAVARLVHARAGRENAQDQAAIAFADAATALARHQPDSALASLRGASALPWGVLRLALTADAFAAAHQTDSAKATLATVISRQWFGAEGEAEWLHAPLVLGDLLLATGDTAAAVPQYRAVLERWQEAASDLPDLVTARTRLKLLAAGR